jgi:putative spermidine/putrescine transport system permease protein
LAPLDRCPKIHFWKKQTFVAWVDLLMQSKRYWQSREGMLVLPALLFFLAIYLYPIIKLFYLSFFDPDLTFKHYAALTAEPMYLVALSNTLEISGWVTLTSLLLGYPLAYLMVTESRRTRTILMALVMIPFWTSILVRTFAWIVILGRNGLINGMLKDMGLIDQPFQMIHNMMGVQIGMLHVLLPFMVFPLYGVMLRIDMGLVLAARSLGASPHRAFIRVFLPLSLPGVTAGCVIVFLLSVGFYITPALLGGPGEITLATLIEMQINDLLNWGFGATLSVALLVVIGIIFVVFSWVMGLDRLTGSGPR